ncbi:MAG TPA: tRNA-dihydrouridine synthase family protein [Polyangiaceae bacterium]|nr:tRNA-dihydrouridine synthase family protein [Polyangiaceae bacterium]
MPRFPFAPACVLAPMEGVTNAAVREVLASYGPVGLVCTEFVRISGGRISRSYLARQVEKLPSVPLSVQVMGNDPELMAEAGAVVARAGADVVDLNLGCPTNAAVRKGVGAALLKQPELLARLLSTMRAAVPGLLSAKLRAGFDTTSDALRNARLVEDSGLDYLTIHPRRRTDHYSGSADWRIVALVRSELRIPVVGNGDIWHAQSALRMFEETRCDAVMLGRPALRNPWIFRQIADLFAGREPFRPSGADLARHLRRLAVALASRAPDPTDSPLGPLKEQLSYLCRGVPDSANFQRRLQRLPTLALLLEAADEAFGALPVEVLDLAAVPGDDAPGRYASC